MTNLHADTMDLVADVHNAHASVPERHHCTACRTWLHRSCREPRSTRRALELGPMTGLALARYANAMSASYVTLLNEGEHVSSGVQSGMRVPRHLRPGARQMRVVNKQTFGAIVCSACKRGVLTEAEPDRASCDLYGGQGSKISSYLCASNAYGLSC